MSLPESFYALKTLLYAFLPFSSDAMHVHIGLFLFLVVAAVAGSGPRRFAIAFGVVLAICLAGEMLDMIYDLQAGQRLRWRNAVKDIANTMLWPGVWAVIGAHLTRNSGEAPAGAARTDPPGLSRQPK